MSNLAIRDRSYGLWNFRPTGPITKHRWNQTLHRMQAQRGSEAGLYLVFRSTLVSTTNVALEELRKTCGRRRKSLHMQLKMNSAAT